MPTRWDPRKAPGTGPRVAARRRRSSCSLTTLHRPVSSSGEASVGLVRTFGVWWRRVKADQRSVRAIEADPTLGITTGLVCQILSAPRKNLSSRNFCHPFLEARVPIQALKVTQNCDGTICRNLPPDRDLSFTCVEPILVGPHDNQERPTVTSIFTGVDSPRFGH